MLEVFHWFLLTRRVEVLWPVRARLRGLLGIRVEVQFVLSRVLPARDGSCQVCPVWRRLRALRHFGHV